jgi:hypothetical protein
MRQANNKPASVDRSDDIEREILKLRKNKSKVATVAGDAVEREIKSLRDSKAKSAAVNSDESFEREIKSLRTSSGKSPIYCTKCGKNLPRMTGIVPIVEPG